MLTTFLTALLGGVVALGGNAVMHLLQNRAKLREERRAWVRTLHKETVDVVVDIDLFNREIRGSVIAGTIASKEDDLRVAIDEKWEGDLLRRLRALYFGHPDPDVRDAAEQVEDAAWPYIVAAQHPLDGEDDPFPFDPDKRPGIHQAMERAMVEFRRAVYAAPIRKLPKVEEYSGENRPSYLARAMAADVRSMS